MTLKVGHDLFQVRAKTEQTMRRSHPANMSYDCPNLVYTTQLSSMLQRSAGSFSRKLQAERSPISLCFRIWGLVHG